MWTEKNGKLTWDGPIEATDFIIGNTQLKNSVKSVTASSPLQSSGGNNPNIALSTGYIDGRRLITSGTWFSVDWENSQLVDYDGNLCLDWANFTLNSSGGDVILDWSSTEIKHYGTAIRFMDNTPGHLLYLYTSGYTNPLQISAKEIYLNPDSTGKIGIGTNTPSDALDVKGNISLKAGNGTYKAHDGSSGITTTITTALLVGKTITVKDGIITGFS
jgi:ethanolamine utilization microcompartment shell protein EutS